MFLLFIGFSKLHWSNYLHLRYITFKCYFYQLCHFVGIKDVTRLLTLSIFIRLSNVVSWAFFFGFCGRYKTWVFSISSGRVWENSFFLCMLFLALSKFYSNNYLRLHYYNDLMGYFCQLCTTCRTLHGPGCGDSRKRMLR